jgi:putative transposase
VCRSSGARFTSIAISSRTRPSACTEVTADYTDMIYAATREEIEARRKAFIRKWRLKHRAVADSLEEAGDRLFTFTRLPPSQWRSARTTNASAGI